VAEASPRRAFLGRLAAAAGVAPAVVGLLEGTVEALPRGEQTDFAVLGAALVLENQAIALYEAGLKQSLFPAGLRNYAVEFRGDHLGHRDTQLAILRERGQAAPEPLQRYVFPHLAPGDEMVQAVLAIEDAAQRAYVTLISQIGTKDYLLSAAFILVDEVRHMTVWRRVLGMRIY
jgi:hypothetical protein